MISLRTRATAALLLSSLALAGCVTDPDTGQQRMSRAGSGAAIGAGAGALLGAILGGRNNTAEVLVGAGLGAVAGGAIGRSQDQREARLRAATANTGIEVQRQGDEIALKIPNEVSFDFNQAAIKPDMRAALDQVAAVLASDQGTLVAVSGHTDAIGSDAFNQALSERRAAAVADYLEYKGIAKTRVTAKGYGKQFPLASNDTDDGRAKNRRVEIRLTDARMAAAGPPAYQPNGFPPPPPGYPSPPPPR
ncbi:MAG: OmpA family protein [Sphingomonadales bacterium]